MKYTPTLEKYVSVLLSFLVLFHRKVAFETLVTFVTLEGFESQMDSFHVQIHCLFVRRHLAAMVAFERLETVVNSLHMQLQTSSVTEGLVTNVTFDVDLLLLNYSFLGLWFCRSFLLGDVRFIHSVSLVFLHVSSVNVVHDFIVL